MSKFLLFLLLLLVLVVGCDKTNPMPVAIIPTPLPIQIASNPNGVPKNLDIFGDGDIHVLASTAAEMINRSGLYEGKTAHAWHIIGRRAGFTSTSVLNDIKEFANSIADIPVLTGGETLEIVSDSASDTLAGTGARSVGIIYLDTGNNLLMSANINLNGVTPVPTGFKANAIEWMEVMAVGSNNVSVGNVILRVNTVGTVLEQITAGGNRSLSARFTVPVGYTGYLTDWSATAILTGGGGGSSQQDIRLRATEDCFDYDYSNVYHFKDTLYINSGTNSPQIILPFIPIPALGTVKTSTISSGTTSSNRVDTSFTILVIAN